MKTPTIMSHGYDNVRTMTTYTLSISGGLASYMPSYEHEHASIESAKREYARVIESLDSTVQGAHLGMIYGSDGSEQSAAS